MLAVLATTLAHQGGWDEILVVLGPLLVFAVLLMIARRRAEKELADEETDETENTQA